MKDHEGFMDMLDVVFWGVVLVVLAPVTEVVASYEEGNDLPVILVVDLRISFHLGHQPVRLMRHVAVLGR